MDPVALLNAPWKRAALALGLIAALLVVAALAAWRGYGFGRETAEAEGRAALAEYEARVAEAGRLASDLARRILDAEIARRDDLERDLRAALKTVAAQRRALTKKEIAHASLDVAVADGLVLLGPDWLRLYNRALGLGDRAGLPGAAARPDGDAGQAGAAESGILRTGGGVTLRDVLAHARDVGRYMGELRARYRALVRWAEGLPRTMEEERRPWN